MASRIKGITVEIGGDTTGLSKALQSVNSKISSTQSQLNDVNKLLKFDPTNTELLAQKQKLLKQAVEATDEKFNSLMEASSQAAEALEKGTLTQEKYDALQREIVATAQASDKYADELENVGKESDEASDSTDKMNNSASKLSKGFSTAKTAVANFVSNLASDAVEKAASTIADFAKSSIQAGMDFDTAMANVAATSGKSVDEITDLRDFAQEMGSTTAFSATEAAEGLNYMALAGYDSEQSMAMLPSVLNLASAGEMELASASDMVTDAQSALGLSTEETSTMVDQMAKASSISNTSVSQLGEAMLQIGATAANVSGGTQDLAVALGVLADNGIKGAEGGTHLRNMILSLQDAAKDGSVDFGDFSVAIYDADGNMRSTTDIMKDLQKNMQGMSQESKDAIISGVFNKTDLASVNAMLNTSTDRFDELSAAIGESAGAAQDMANTKLDNLAGDVTLFQSALEGAQIALSDKLAPALRDIVSSGSDAMNALTEGFQTGDFSGVADAVEEIVDKILETLTSILPGVMDVASQMVSAIIDVVSKELPKLYSTGTDILMKIISGFVSAIPQLIVAWTQASTSLLHSIQQALPQLIAMIPTVINSIVTGFISNLQPLLDVSLQLILTLIQGISNALPQLVEYLPTLINTIVLFILENLPLIIDTATQIITAILTGLTEALPQLIEYIPSIILNIIAVIIAMLPQVLESGAKLLKALIEGLGSLNDALQKAVHGIIKKIVDSFLNTVDTVLGIGKSIISGLISGIGQKVSDVKDKIGEVITAIKDKFLDVVDDVKDIGENIVEGLWNGISDKVDWLCDKIKGFSSTVTNELKDFFGINSPSRLMRDEIGNYLAEGIGVGFIDGLDNVLSDVRKASAQMTGSIQGAMSGNYSSTISNGGAISGSSVGTTIINNDYSKTVNQTNNSPSSLSRLEIYRQTTNALKI